MPVAPPVPAAPTPASAPSHKDHESVDWAALRDEGADEFVRQFVRQRQPLVARVLLALRKPTAIVVPTDQRCKVCEGDDVPCVLDGDLFGDDARHACAGCTMKTNGRRDRCEFFTEGSRTVPPVVGAWSAYEERVRNNYRRGALLDLKAASEERTAWVQTSKREGVSYLWTEVDETDSENRAGSERRGHHGDDEVVVKQEEEEEVQVQVVARDAGAEQAEEEDELHSDGEDEQEPVVQVKLERADTEEQASSSSVRSSHSNSDHQTPPTSLDDTSSKARTPGSEGDGASNNAGTPAAGTSWSVEPSAATSDADADAETDADTDADSSDANTSRADNSPPSNASTYDDCDSGSNTMLVVHAVPLGNWSSARHLNRPRYYVQVSAKHVDSVFDLEPEDDSGTLLGPSRATAFLERVEVVTAPMVEFIIHARDKHKEATPVESEVDSESGNGDDSDEEKEVAADESGKEETPIMIPPFLYHPRLPCSACSSLRRTCFVTPPLVVPASGPSNLPVEMPECVPCAAQFPNKCKWRTETIDEYCPALRDVIDVGPVQAALAD